MTPLRPQAVIFDLDGVLADTEPLYLEVTNELLRPWGVRISAEQHYALAGAPLGVYAEWLVRALGVPLAPEELEERLRAAALRRLEAPLPPNPGAVELLDALEQAGVARAVGTGASRAAAELLLRSLGLRHRFSVVVTADDVPAGKPAPDTFLACAAALGVAPPRCAVIEDATNGVQAAIAAGMPVIALRTRGNRGTPFPGAYAVVGDLFEARSWLLGRPAGF